jgi:succinyl-diaminopimelate desuccinylase
MFKLGESYMYDKNVIENWIGKYQSSIINDIMELIKIRSVSEKSGSTYPYGAGCAKVLDKALALGAIKGFETKNHAYHCGSVLLKGETEKEIGIFTHLDVVHEGNGWQSDPYQPYLREGWLFGRGSADNKPAVAALYAMNFLREQAIPLKHTLRLYFGCDEEAGMNDIAYYKAHYKIPNFSFAPDASFPVCYAEKGIMEVELSTTLVGNVCAFSAGSAANSVPSQAKAMIEYASFESVENFLRGRSDFFVQKKGKGIIIGARGRSAHAAFPEGSESAAVKLAQMFCHAPFINEKSKACLRFVGEAIDGYYGQGMGLACEDKLSGKLTLIGGIVQVKNDRLVQNINIRYPVSVDQEEIVHKIYTCGEQYGWKVDWLSNNPPYCIEPKSEIVTKLNSICCDILQTDLPPYAMGGGTYARKLCNAVAYGPGIRGQVKPCPPGHGGGHQPDECVKVENLTKAANGKIIYV